MTKLRFTIELVGLMLAGLSVIAVSTAVGLGVAKLMGETIIW